MNTFTQNFDKVLDSIQSLLMSILTKLGPFLVALMPSSFLAYSIYHTFENSAGSNLALFFAIVVGAAWETVGIIACHTAIDLYNAAEDKTIQPAKFWVMLALIPVYVLGVAGVVYFSQDAFVPLVKGLGVASPFLTTITYTAVALARDIRKIEAKQASVEDRQAEAEAEQRRLEQEREAQEREWQHEKERMEMELKHSERLAKISAKNARITTQNDAQESEGIAQGGQILPLLRVPKSEWRAKAIEVLRENPHISGAQLGRELGASNRTGQHILNELEQAGVVHKNGDGWRVTA